ILVFDDKEVFAFGREPQYFKWTTTMAYQLSATGKAPPEVVPNPKEGQDKKPAAGAKKDPEPDYPNVKFPDDAKLNLAKTALTVEAWVLPDGLDGTIVQYGGHATGFSLALQAGRPGFSVRAANADATAQAQRPLDAGWHHLAGVLSENKKMRLYVDGQLAAE